MGIKYYPLKQLFGTQMCIHTKMYWLIPEKLVAVQCFDFCSIFIYW